MKVAIIQHKPVHLDLEKSVKKAIDFIKEAAEYNADLVVFGETWLTGYPAWIDYSPSIGKWDDAATKKVYARLIENSISVDSQEIKLLKEACKSEEVGLVMGVNEVCKKSKGTTYNSIFMINEKGELVNHHRKLVPTYTERLLHAHGDAAGLKSVTIKGVNITASICWEHWMPLTRQALHDSNEEVHIALWPTVHERHQIASRHYAFEGRCFVVAVGQIMAVEDFPEELELPDNLKANSEKLVLNGGGCVIMPDGFYQEEPVFDKECIIYADLEIRKTREESLTLDVTGHYQRKDVFQLTIDRNRV